MTAAASTPPPGDGSGPQERPASPAVPSQGAEAHGAAAGEPALWASASATSLTPATSPPGNRPPPLANGLRGAPPPPPPAWTPAPTGTAIAEEEGRGLDSRAARRHARHRLGGEPPARIALANRQPVFVTLNDISSGGCCIVRKGRLELSLGDAVMVDIWTHDITAKLSLHARVCWASHQEATSRAGLRFVETNHRLLRQIEAYVQHFHRPVDDSRPQARVPDPSRGAVAEPLQPQQNLAPSTPPPSRVRRSERSAMRAPERRDLASMPRPGRLTSLDLQRRMRPAHRHEVARIAEETGIHIHTLYGWLRTLRLEGEVNPERPRDPEAWSATDKFSALLQVTGLGAAERDAYCQRHGIAEEQLQRWRQAALRANEKPLLILRAEEELQRLRVRDQRDIRRLQKELRRRERSASISEELLQVVRKLQTLWEQGDSH